jgi:hypothetical protein
MDFLCRYCSARGSDNQLQRKDILLASDLSSLYDRDRSLAEHFPLFKSVRTDRCEGWVDKSRGWNVIEAHHRAILRNGKARLPE